MSTDLLVLISNIPKKFRSRELRDFFSSFVEGDKFRVFHYKHRPQIIQNTQKSSSSSSTSSKTCCCYVKLKSRAILEDFFRNYQNKQWVGEDGVYLSSRCRLSKFSHSSSSTQQSSTQQSSTQSSSSLAQSSSSLAQSSSSPTHSSSPTQDESPPRKWFTRREKRELAVRKYQEISDNSEKILSLPELHPPGALPRGNVGTSKRELLERIPNLPTTFLKALKIDEIFRAPRGEYTRVNLDYKRIDKHLSIEEQFASDTFEKNLDVEEWERSASMHPLPDRSIQRRDRLDVDEALFEDKVDNPWDKGDASGLVYYTDASYWDNKKGDFDERTVDDWNVPDVDLERENDEPKLKLSRREPQKVRFLDKKEAAPSANPVTPISTTVAPISATVTPTSATATPIEKEEYVHVQPAMGYIPLERTDRRKEDFMKRNDEMTGFEKFTLSGFGGKYLRKHGWKYGEGVGKNKSGIKTALKVNIDQQRQGVGFAKKKRKSNPGLNTASHGEEGSSVNYPRKRKKNYYKKKPVVHPWHKEYEYSLEKEKKNTHWIKTVYDSGSDDESEKEKGKNDVGSFSLLSDIS